MPKFTFASLVAIVMVAVSSFSSALAASDTIMQPAKKPAMDHSTMDHGSHNAASKMNETLPTEPGQGAFATIAEIVGILTNDPMTDWSKFDIAGLREHLIDMDELALRAQSTTNVQDGKIVFIVTGTGRTLQAIQSMVPAHAAVLARTTAWDTKGEITKNGAMLTISSENPQALKVVKALGFFGVMATGAHHQAHHLAMAKGDTSTHAHN